MSSAILRKSYAAPPFCKRDILRYAGCRAEESDVAALAESCIEEVRDKLTYRVCYRHFNVVTDGELCNFEDMFTLRSEKLAQSLDTCSEVVLFASTVGVGIDRLIARYGHLSPSRALMLQAVGAERIEALCDSFCADLEREYDCGTRPRFSPGYGDLSLAAQRQLFAVLSPERQIGLTLTDSLLMSPSKSVTAIVGLTAQKEAAVSCKCTLCDKIDCTYRGSI